MRWIRLIVILALITSSTFGCNDDDQQTADKEKKDKKKVEAQDKEKGGKLITAHYLEEEVETIAEIQHATVVKQNRDAYIALELTEEDASQLNEELKNKVVGTIRVTDPEINNIYISNETDFNTRMQSLTRDIERGLPAKEIGESFEQSIRKVFPELKR
jgi:YhcN/YlaJ family sporulation lipoprotein